MSFGLRYDQLKPVAGTVWAGLLPYNGNDPEHEDVLRKELPRFLGTLCSVHGGTFPKQHLDAVIEMVNAKVVDVHICQASLEKDGPIINLGMATGGVVFDPEWDENNNRKLFTIYHGEDLVVDAEIAKLFREYSQCLLYPNGVGAGSWIMREQILHSVSNPHWVFAGRDNEYRRDNHRIIGVMDKYGAIHGTKRNSAVLQLDRLTSDMTRRWRVRIETEALPADPLGLRPCPNNFLTRWASKDGKQQMAATHRNWGSTVDGQPVVWTKIKSNGNPPKGEMLKEVLASLSLAGCEEIANRRWGVPRKMLNTANDLSYIFGGPVPVMHLHLNNEPEILEALLEMGAKHRMFGNDTMLSGVMRLKNIRNPESVLGYKPSEATQVNAINPERDANKPYFDVAPEIKKDSSKIYFPERPIVFRADNDDFLALKAA